MRRGSAETPQYTGSRGLQTSKKPWSHDWPRPETTVRPYCSYCPCFLSSSLPLSRPSRHAILGHDLHCRLDSPPSLHHPSVHPSLKLSFCIPSLSCRHDPYIHYCNSTSNNATQCHVTSTFFCTSPYFRSHYTRMPLAGKPSVHTH